jgi:hypothetical protein
MRDCGVLIFSISKCLINGYTRIGYDTVDAGSLAESWRFEPGTPAYGPPSPHAPGAENFTEVPGQPAGADALREALAAARHLTGPAG